MDRHALGVGVFHGWPLLSIEFGLSSALRLARDRNTLQAERAWSADGGRF